MKRLLIFTIILVGFKSTIHAQFLKGKTAIIPVLFYSPDTRFGYGVAGLNTFQFSEKDTISNPSQVQLLLAYTQNKQSLVFLSYDMFVKENKYQIRGELGYYEYLNYYFGIGTKKALKQRESYTEQYPRIRIDALRNIGKQQYFGLKYAVDDYQIIDYSPNNPLQNDSTITGYKGGIVSGLGFIYRMDKRNEIFWPSKGFQLESYIQSFNKAIFSAFNYLLFGTEYTNYFSFGSNIIATQYFFHGSQGDVPFYQLPSLGGPKRLRGYYQSQFRDKFVMGFQSEYRSPTVLNERLAFIAFVGLGNQFGIDSDILQTWKYSYGAGMRIRINKKDKVHMRLDYGFGKGVSGFYFTIGEAF